MPNHYYIPPLHPHLFKQKKNIQIYLKTKKKQEKHFCNIFKYIEKKTKQKYTDVKQKKCTK